MFGAGAGAIGYGIGALYDGKFNGIDFGAAILGGALQGALAPIGGGWFGAMALAGSVNVVQDIAKYHVKSTLQCTPSGDVDVLRSFVIGAVAGMIGGPWSKTARYTDVRFSDWAREGNNARAIAANIGLRNFSLNVAGSAGAEIASGDGK